MFEKYTCLDYSVKWYKKLLRIVIGVAFAFGVKEIIHIFENCGGIRAMFLVNFAGYMLMVIAVIGICPVLFKKIKL